MGLGLEGAAVAAERAETLGQAPEYREAFDVVLARALAPLPVLAELTLPFCRRGGVVVAYKSPGVEDEAAEARVAIKLLGGAAARIVEVPASVSGDPRTLVVIEKRGPTPRKYPRRPGAPAKQPLLAAGDPGVAGSGALRAPARLAARALSQSPPEGERL